MSRRLLIVVNDAEFFLSHRLPIAMAAAASGYEVHVATAPGPGATTIAAHGLIFHEVPMTRSGRNPLQEIGTLLALYRLVAKIRPDVLHLVTIKPVLYGGIVARATGVPAVVSAISGLGHVFGTGGRQRLLRTLIAPAYRLALGHSNLRLVFQNSEDREVLTRFAGVPAERTSLIRGSGVELGEYRQVPEPEGTPVAVFASRLLAPKGVREFVAAARIVRETGMVARFLLVGKTDTGNPLSISQAELEQWSSEGDVEVLGHRTDVPEVFANANLVVLPSYYGEGVPKVLLEAAACGRAVVTTDHAGCRDAIVDGTTGLLVPVKDTVRLAAAMERLLRDSELRHAFGKAARTFAEQEFPVEAVVSRHLEIYRELEARAER